VLISLATLCPTFAKSSRDTEIVQEEATPEVEFSDDSPSEESDGEDNSNDSDDDSKDE
jgi:hypothetical protein